MPDCAFADDVRVDVHERVLNNTWLVVLNSNERVDELWLGGVRARRSERDNRFGVALDDAPARSGPLPLTLVGAESGRRRTTLFDPLLSGVFVPQLRVAAAAAADDDDAPLLASTTAAAPRTTAAAPAVTTSARSSERERTSAERTSTAQRTFAGLPGDGPVLGTAPDALPGSTIEAAAVIGMLCLAGVFFTTLVWMIMIFLDRRHGPVDDALN